jgi:hypothetical protein
VALDPNNIVVSPYGGILSTQQSGEIPAEDGNIDPLETQP